MYWHSINSYVSPFGFDLTVGGWVSGFGRIRACFVIPVVTVLEKSIGPTGIPALLPVLIKGDVTN